jgi:magnesium chelatase subunit H
MFAQRIYNSKEALKMVATDKPPKIDNLDISVSGMFTNSSPDTKRVVPSNMEGKTKFKIVYVVLESQYQSSLTKACESINAGKEGVAVEAVGYLLEELRSAKVYEQFKEDVSNANIFIGSLIFVEELADKVPSVHCVCSAKCR